MRTIKVSVDVPGDEHFYFKLACVKLKTTLEAFLLEAGEKRLEEIENEWLTAEVDQIKERIAKGEETFEPLEKIVKDLDLECTKSN